MGITINMVEEIDKDPEEGFVEVEGEKFKEDPENSGESLKDDEGNPIPFEEQSKEPDVPPEVTAQDAMNLAQALQKGYTLTRQDMASIRENQDKIQQALEKLGKKDDFEDDGDEPLTVKGFLALQSKQQEQKKAEDSKFNQRIERDLDELRFQGVIKTEADKDELLNFAVKRKITNLSVAAERWQEIKQAKKEGLVEGLKGKVKVEAGKKIGTSQKTGTKEQGFDYSEIAGKDMDELAEE